MPTLLALLPLGRPRSALSEALRTPTTRGLVRTSIFAESWAEAHHLASRHPPTLLVFDPYVTDVPDWERCAAFLHAFPSTAALPYGDFTGERVRDVVRLTQLGIMSLVMQSASGEAGGDDAPLPFGLHLVDALSGSVAGRVLAALGDVIPDGLVPAVRYVLFAAERPVPPHAIARAVHCHEATLRTQLRQAGLPPTKKLIVWARLFHAAHLLGSGRRTVESVALLLDFPSASALANQLGRYVGVRPGELAGQPGALEHLILCFRERFIRADWALSSAPEPAQGRSIGNIRSAA